MLLIDFVHALRHASDETTQGDHTRSHGGNLNRGLAASCDGRCVRLGRRRWRPNRLVGDNTEESRGLGAVDHAVQRWQVPSVSQRLQAR
jgi:hypothetical protein